MVNDPVVELIARVDELFEERDPALVPWADPWPRRSPADDAYSRVANAAKYRIGGARADAWVDALVSDNLATIELGVPAVWRDDRLPIIRTDRLTPVALGGLAIALGRSRIGDVDDAGLILGVGEPLVAVLLLPDCGCDACDSGSDDLLEVIDDAFRGIVTGAFRYLEKDAQSITTFGDGYSARGEFAGPNKSILRRKRTVQEILAEPKDWSELRGATWFER